MDLLRGLRVLHLVHAAARRPPAAAGAGVGHARRVRHRQAGRAVGPAGWRKGHMTQNPDAAPQFDPDEVWTVKQFTSARNALRFYRVMELLTGTMLMILTVEMLYKYLYVPRVLGGSPSEALNFGGFDLAAAIAISHRWCHGVDLIAGFWLHQAMRCKIGRLLHLA